MRYMILTFVIFFISMSTIMSTADAARFGGGKSFGMSRSISSTRNFNPSNTGVQRSSMSPTNRWLGPLAGLAMGGLLASLFMGHGLGAGMMSWLLVGGAIFLIWRLISSMQRSNRLQTQPPAYNNVMPLNAAENIYNTNTTSSQFDEVSFLRQAKAIFIRLQAAYDNKNLADIRTYTSPEIYAEIQLQLHERGDAVNFTEVLNIDAQLADVDIQSDRLVASVTFRGQLREGHDAVPIQINEMWHFQQLKNETQWVVMGIQQS